ncbi:formimidoylglutamate deiminase [Roseobacter sp. SK209-2-6]|uniref:formimidoylglutamate deiminase n=1 Tax=Roseobacter sp. SK209-2-6 TaxID=388739 RepID=UPI0002EDF137|nr:formimidoylglutamate deiminase [Roseobacter sp. SK209-2-6]
MTALFAKRALLPGGWAENLRLEIECGHISTLAADGMAQPGDTQVDTLLPALANLHSHAFQRAMAGMTEYRMAGRDSFWTWRDLMYRFTAQLSPEQIEAIAALVYLEMQEAGYASVGEFHYLHHQKDGSAYDNLAEHSDRIMAAALETGIGLTHLPVLYSYAGVGEKPLESGQARFGNDMSRFCRLVDQAKAHAAGQLPADCRVGIAPHSLRATSPRDLEDVLQAHGEGPVHIHIAEQPKEVQEVLEGMSARPVEWLLENAPVDAHWCLIHATHMTDEETRNMAASGAVAGLCPVTEANLGDGPFNGATYLQAGGAFGVGSDSNVLISLTEELRTLEYSQRLRDLSRNVLVPGSEGSVGQTLYCGAAAGGAQALGRKSGRIETGQLADLVAIDSQDPALCALQPEQILDGLVFAAKDHVVTDLWSGGRHMVRDGSHIARDSILKQYRKAIEELVDSL